MGRAKRILDNISFGRFHDLRNSAVDLRLIMLRIMLHMQLFSIIALKAISLPPVAGETLMGVNLGFNGDMLPSIPDTVSLLSGLHAGAVRLYDANPEFLSALQGSPIEVIVSVRNDELEVIAGGQSAAAGWVENHVTPYYPATRITYIAVGNEVLHDANLGMFAQYIVPALYNIHGALVSRMMQHSVKVITPLSGEILTWPWPPANGTFGLLQYVTPILQFLHDTNSTFFINLYPYYALMEDSLNVTMDFATFQRTIPAYSDPLSGLPYYNLLDAMLDATYTAIAKLGFSNMRIAVGETGWPTAGGGSATSVDNARIFNENLVRHMLTGGTPLRPEVRTPVFIFALFNENLKPGPDFEQYWGILKADGTPAYPLDLAMPKEGQIETLK